MKCGKHQNGLAQMFCGRLHNEIRIDRESKEIIKTKGQRENKTHNEPTKPRVTCHALLLLPS